jgi:hypothetical protein
MKIEDREQVLAIVQQLLEDNANNRITLSLAQGIIATASAACSTWTRRHNLRRRPSCLKTAWQRPRRETALLAVRPAGRAVRRLRRWLTG